MNMFFRIARPVGFAVSVAVFTLSVQQPGAHAAMIGTGLVVQDVHAQQDRARIRAALERKDVRAKLVSLGVDPAEVRQRVNALTDGEARQLAASLDQLPAGADFGAGAVVGAVVFIFLVLLITDLLGLTDVFPFVKHHG
jgi:hypothetical protein